MQVKKISTISWYPFNTETLNKAKEENKTIYLFVEADSSYWSKQMLEEISSNENVVELLNERFIPIKINKDERPDIEKYYQRVYTLMNRQAGALPLNIFLTPALEPYYADSYIAPHDVDAQLAFESLLRVVSKKQITDHETLSSKGQEVLAYIDPKEEHIEATKLHLDIMKTISNHSQQLLDKEFGGFTKAPKFPNVTTLELLLDVYELTQEQTLLESVTLTLDKMSQGGFYELENGGFNLYAKDQAWSEPYVFKTTYDNALLTSLYLRTYNLTQNESYKKIAFATLDFMLSQQDEQKLFSLEGESLVLSSWNAMVIRALFKAGNFDETYTLKALETLEALLSNFYLNGMLYHAKYPKKEAHIKAFLEDYSQVGETLIVAYEQTLDESFLIMATQFANLLIEQYYQQGRWVYSTNEFQVRESIHDSNIPSSLASSLSLLLSISSLVDNNYKKFVFKSLELHSYNLMRQPLSSPRLTQMMLRYLKDDLVIKSKEENLKPVIKQKESLGYPYLLLKSSQNSEFELWNSHSMITSSSDFSEIKSYLKKRP